MSRKPAGEGRKQERQAWRLLTVGIAHLKYYDYKGNFPQPALGLFCGLFLQARFELLALSQIQLIFILINDSTLNQGQQRRRGKTTEQLRVQMSLLAVLPWAPRPLSFGWLG